MTRPPWISITLDVTYDASSDARKAAYAATSSGRPMRRSATVQSDNPAYPDWPDCRINELNCIGRVIWAGRKIL